MENLTQYLIQFKKNAIQTLQDPQFLKTAAIITAIHIAAWVCMEVYYWHKYKRKAK